MKKINKILISTIICLGLIVPFQVWAQKYTVKKVSNGGTITGTITYSGEAVAPKKLKIDKDKKVCSHDQPTYSEVLLINKENRGIQNVVVSITNISQGKDWSLPEGGPVLDQKGCWFSPHLLVVPAGLTFYIQNNDGILHNIHTHSKINRPVNKAQPKFLKRLKMKFDKPEYVQISCDVHNWMDGWVVVAAHPYYAVADKNGSFTLDNVPSGSYEVEIWHEKLGKQTQKVTVKGGADAKVNAVFASK